eukprot:Opistho-2@19578
MDDGFKVPLLPSGKGKRRATDDDEDTSTRKRPAYDAYDSIDTGVSEEERRRILAMVENEEAEGEALDSVSMKKAVLAFEKKMYRNQELRVKYIDQPERFMESEVELHEEIQRLHVLATAPELYAELVQLNVIPSIVGLLGHDNTDISIAVVDLLQEMTDVESPDEYKEEVDALVDALMESSGLEALVGNMERLNEGVREDDDGAHNSLAVVENLVELRQNIARDIVSRTQIMPWMMGRLRSGAPFDGVRLYCSEVLAILLQSVDENRVKLGELDGIDLLLRTVAPYKRKDPQSNEESEFVENLFDCICAALLSAPNKARFVDVEGIELCLIMLKERKTASQGALKAIDHALSGSQGGPGCDRLIDALGLKVIFPYFMKTPSSKKRQGLTDTEYEEHICSIVASLFRHVSESRRPRLLNKFVEDDFVKRDRLAELHRKYYALVVQKDAEYREEMEERREEEGDDFDEGTELVGLYLARLDAGLFTLQLIDYTMASAIAAGVPEIASRITMVLAQGGSSVDQVRSILKEYADNVGDALDSDSREREKGAITGVVDRMNAAISDPK